MYCDRKNLEKGPNTSGNRKMGRGTELSAESTAPIGRRDRFPTDRILATNSEKVLEGTEKKMCKSSLLFTVHDSNCKELKSRSHGKNQAHE